MFDQHFSDLNYLKIKLTMTAYKSLHRCLTYKFEVSLESSRTVNINIHLAISDLHFFGVVTVSLTLTDNKSLHRCPTDQYKLLLESSTYWLLI